MRMAALATCTLLLSLIGPCGFAETPAWNAEIRPVQTAARSGEAFLVETAIRNVGRTDQVLGVWSCTYAMRWIVDSPFVHVSGSPCLKNSFRRIKLKPGEAYKHSISIYIALPSDRRRSESIAFRMEFGSVTSRGAWKPEVPAVWSNAAAVTVVR